MTKPGTGRIYMPNPENEPLKIRGLGTKFTEQAMVGGLLVLPAVGTSSAASTEIGQVLNDEELVLKKPFRGQTAVDQLTQETDDGKGTMFKTAPKVDQTKVYDAVFNRLNSGGCVGIFPEGGSHDRTELLPLKGSYV
jgi:glycerol-3-phosphate O-acyltransferase/dihydroxyacetone phosphate acyltransferase